jgi:uridylate kinase
MKKETIIISLGGSLMAPDEIDVSFLKSFKTSIKKHLNNKRFFIIVGGGKVARVYQKALLEFGSKSVDRDWIGIKVTRLNAEVMKQLFKGDCYPKTIENPNEKIKTTKDIVIGAGYKPGWSTDYVSVLIAKNYGIKTIINLSNIDYVHDKDPRKFPDAKKFENIDWKSFRRIVGDVWEPGLSMPFDPRASKLAESLKLEVVVMNGKKLERLDNFLNEKSFIGTIIQ